MADYVASTSNVWPNYAKANMSNAPANQGQLGKDDFLKILLAQLKHQDPTQPLKDTDFIAQMAQFSTMEQLVSISSDMKNLSQSMGIASSIIGKSVSWIEHSQLGSTTKSGIVNAITVENGIQYVTAGKDIIPLSELVRIANASDAVVDATEETGVEDSP